MKPSLIPRYKRYWPGGQMTDVEKSRATGITANTQQTNQVGSQIQGVASGVANAIVPGAGSLLTAASQLGTGIVDAFDKKDENGVGSMGAAIAKGGLQFGVAGAVIAGINHKKDLANSRNLTFQRKMQEKQMAEADLTARVGADPTLLKGNLASNYYAAGGMMSNNISTPHAKNLSSTAVEFTGPSHERGGIKLDNLGAEVEGEESANAGYVFSKRLGFADLHKPIAKAIGKIEGKALNPSRINSIKILKAEENNLKLSQEYLKHTMGIN